MSTSAPPIADANPASAPEADTAVLMEGVDVFYGTHAALTDVSLDVQRGEIVGLLGHNGAGKTTTIRLLNGLLKPSSGTIRVLGVNPLDGGADFRRQTSVVNDSLGLHERETARQAMAFHADLFGLDAASAGEQAVELLSRFGLRDAIDQPVKSYSRGMRQRLALARSLLHEPKLLLLDEPTLGMDPVGRREFRLILQQLSAGGTSVLMSTHDLGEVERACDRVVILHQGSVILKGSPAETIESSVRNLEVTVDFGTAVRSEWVTVVGQHSAVAHEDLRSLSFVIEERATIAPVVAALVAAGAPILGVTTVAPTLEDVYIAMHSDTGGRA